jgi:hypothetical protein
VKPKDRPADDRGETSCPAAHRTRCSAARRLRAARTGTPPPAGRERRRHTPGRALGCGCAATSRSAGGCPSARQVLNPHREVVWTARAAGVIAGSDRYLDGTGAMDWKLAGMVALAPADGTDVTRSATAGPVAPRPRGRGAVAGLRPVSDPDRTGTWGWYRFGGAIGYGTFAGLTIPSRGLPVGISTPHRWSTGEFFRYEINRAETPARGRRATSEPAAPTGMAARHPVGCFILFGYG